MKIIMIALFSLHMLYAQAINKKMILSANLTLEDAGKSLYDAEKFFQENTQANVLKKMYKLSVNMELLEPYILVTVQPIKSLSVKNKLHYLLQSKFPQSFVVDTIKKVAKKTKKYATNVKTSTPISKKTSQKLKQKPQPIPSINQEKKGTVFVKMEQFWRSLDREWLGLIFLALAGFLLIYRSARQMSKIKSLQKEVSKYQNKIEGEMNTMGDKYA